MDELITITNKDFGGSEGVIPTVNGRDLHEFLEIKAKYTDWAQYQIKRCKFAEGRDYIVFHNVMNNPSVGLGGRPMTDHAFTLDAGKHIGMMSGTDNGHQVRRYFIACEKRSRFTMIELIKDPEKMYDALLSINRESLVQKKVIAELTPKAEFCDAVTRHPGLISFLDMAAYISRNGVDIGRNKFFEALRNKGYLIKQKGRSFNHPTRYSVQHGLITLVQDVAKHDILPDRPVQTPMFTGKGQVYFLKKAQIPGWFEHNLRGNKQGTSEHG